MTHHHPTPARAPRNHHRQRGIAMLFGLIALAIMMIGAAAMIRSMNTSMFNAGNLGFKRDLTNQAERAAADVMTLLQTGALGTEAARQASATTRNYSATLLASNAQGLPNALVDDASFSAAGAAGNDISVAAQGITVRYLVDRMCVNTGAATATHCTMADDPVPSGGSGSELMRAEDTAIGQRVVYRVSIRVAGPRSTQAYFQTTLTL
jgi:hypothetical protein